MKTCKWRYCRRPVTGTFCCEDHRRKHDSYTAKEKARRKVKNATARRRATNEREQWKRADPTPAEVEAQARLDALARRAAEIEARFGEMLDVEPIPPELAPLSVARGPA